MVWEELKEALIFPEVDAADSADVMRKIGSAFIREGYCKESYVDALIEREAEYPTGLDIDGIGVAIPHTPVEHVNESATAIAVLKNPVTFVQMGDDETTEVKLIFMLAVRDPKAHLDKLQTILAIIQDKDVLGKLLKATDKEEIINIVKEKEITL